MSTAGHWRPVYVSLLRDPAWRVLSPEARSVWLSIKLLLGPGGIGDLWDGQICAASGVAYDRVSAAIAEVEKAGWVEKDGDTFWMINGFAHECGHHGPNQLKSVARHVADVGGPLADRFRERYDDILPSESK